MHLAIRVSELLAIIFGHVTSKRDLFRILQVCKTWFTPAVEQLWKEVSSFTPLLNLIGPTTYCNDDTAWALNVVPTPEIWDRFYLYSSKVRTLRDCTWTYWGPGIKLADKYPHTVPTDDVVHMLSNPQHSAGGPLFPSLQSFGKKGDMPIRFYTPQDLTLTAMFSKAPLREIFIRLMSQGSIRPLDCERIRIWFRSLPTQFPSLRSISVSVATLDSIFPDDFISLSQFPALQTFGLMSSGTLRITPQFLQILSGLTELKDLVLPALSGTLPEGEKLHSNPFPLLKTFDVGQFEVLLPALLEASGFRPRYLKHLCGSPRRPKAFAKLVQCVRTSRQSLQSFIFTFRSLFDLRKEYLDVVFTFPKLQILRLQGIFGLLLTDSDIHKLVKGTPLLRQLHMPSRAQPESGTRTLLTIHHLLRQCSNMELISLTIDATVPPVTPLSRSHARGRYVQGDETPRLLIDVNHSTIKDAPLVAEWIKIRCERLVKGTYKLKWRSDHEEVTGLWANVGRLLQGERASMEPLVVVKDVGPIQ